MFFPKGNAHQERHVTALSSVMRDPQDAQGEERGASASSHVFQVVHSLQQRHPLPLTALHAQPWPSPCRRGFRRQPLAQPSGLRVRGVPACLSACKAAGTQPRPFYVHSPVHAAAAGPTPLPARGSALRLHGSGCGRLWRPGSCVSGGHSHRSPRLSTHHDLT